MATQATNEEQINPLQPLQQVQILIDEAQPQQQQQEEEEVEEESKAEEELVTSPIASVSSPTSGGTRSGADSSLLDRLRR